jgi:hypothetical protein
VGIVSEVLIQGAVFTSAPSTSPLAVLKCIAGFDNESEALTNKARGNTLLPLQSTCNAQFNTPLTLLREMAKRFWAVDPKHPPLVIKKIALVPVSDPHHAISLILPKQLLAT